MSTWDAEWRRLPDQHGWRWTQLTCRGNNVHLYFTENAFNRGRPEIIFLSDRASGLELAPHEHPDYQIFRLNLGSGRIEQLTDEPAPVQRVTKTPEGDLIVYTTGDRLIALEPATGRRVELYRESEGLSLGQPSINADRTLVGLARNEQGAAHGPNYAGFKERYYGIKDGRITLVPLTGDAPLEVFHDTHQLAHFQFSPRDPTLALFCHEGPWHLVTQRMWRLNTVTGRVQPLFRQGEDDSVGHEFWTQDGLIFFDNRGPGHDGTITSTKTQAVAVDVGFKQVGAFEPFVGLLDPDGRLLRRIPLPYACNHYHANPDNTWLVGDDVDELVLIDLTQSPPTRQPVLAHGTSWHTQASHCHPTWSWDGDQILYASDQGGRVNLYLLQKLSANSHQLRPRRDS